MPRWGWGCFRAAWADGATQALRATPSPRGCCRSRRPRSKRPGRQGVSQRVRSSPLQIGNWKPVSGKLSFATLAEKLSRWSIGFRDEDLSRHRRVRDFPNSCGSDCAGVETPASLRKALRGAGRGSETDNGASKSASQRVSKGRERGNGGRREGLIASRPVPGGSGCGAGRGLASEDARDSRSHRSRRWRARLRLR